MTHDTGLYDLCADVNRWQVEQLMYLVNHLQTTPEGDGTLLDNTVVVWFSECAQTYQGDPHDLTNMGFTLIGGGQGYFNTGQYIEFPGGDSYSHSRLLVTLAQYMGLNVESVGLPEYCTEGPLPHIVA